MGIKMTNIRKVGRFINPDTNRPVNVHKGRRVGRSTDHYFWILRGTRQIISQDEYFKKWKPNQIENNYGQSNKEKYIQIRVNDAQKDEIKDHAQQAGMTVTAFLLLACKSYVSSDDYIAKKNMQKLRKEFKRRGQK